MHKEYTGPYSRLYIWSVSRLCKMGMQYLHGCVRCTHLGKPETYASADGTGLVLSACCRRNGSMMLHCVPWSHTWSCSLESCSQTGSGMKSPRAPRNWPTCKYATIMHFTPSSHQSCMNGKGEEDATSFCQPTWLITCTTHGNMVHIFMKSRQSMTYLEKYMK